MPIFNILNSEEKREFDNPPKLTGDERKKYFRLNLEIQVILDSLRTPSSKVIAFVNYGYLKKSGKIFMDPIKADIEFVCNALKIGKESLALDKFDRFNFRSIKNKLIEELGYCEFDTSEINRTREQIKFYLRSQTRHRQIFGSIADKLFKDQILLPSYNTLATIIDEEVKIYDKKIEANLVKCLSKSDIDELELLLSKPVEDLEVEADSKIEQSDNTPFILTRLKHFNQSNKPKKVRKNLESLEMLTRLFHKFEPARSAVDFTDEGIKYYAGLTMKQKLSQMTQRSNEARLIYFYCFVNHQYFRLNDHLADTILFSVAGFNNKVKKDTETTYLESKAQKEKFLKQAQESRKKQIVSYGKMRAIIKSNALTEMEKVNQLDLLIDEAEAGLMPKEMIQEIEEADSKNEFHFMEINSKSLILKVSEVIKNLEFSRNEQTSNMELLEAIDHYCNTNGEVGVKPPKEFLSSQQRKKLKQGKGFKKSLYKVFLFQSVADNLKAGRLNLKHSYRFRSAQEYLIHVKDFTENKEKYLQLAQLEDKQDFRMIEKSLTLKSDSAYELTNTNILSGKNKLIKFDDKGDFTLETSKIQESLTKLSDILPKEKYISLIEIMYTIATSSGFCDSLENTQQSGRKQTLPKEVLLASIFALGCNIGIAKAAKITHLSESELDYAKKWYLSMENLKMANEKVIETAIKLDLPNIHFQEDGKLYTSSDGQKILNHSESFNANYSYKYGGSAKASSIYTFIDMRQILFHSTVISASEREAIYVVDGLLHSKWIKSDIHSTDTFGATEAVFGLCYLLGYDLVPRIKDLSEQTLYATTHKKEYESKKYKLLPDRKINFDLIETEWDNLLRLATSIKLGICSGSQILKRLNSYSRKNKFYQALRELGRLVKSITILTFIGNEELRQKVEKQLNLVENSNKFSKVIRFGNGGNIKQKDKEDQDIAESCKRLQVNSIILHNYMYLTKKLQNEPDERTKQDMLKIIRNGSAISWSHINFFGEYNFNEKDNPDSFDLNMSKIKEFKLKDILDAVSGG